MQRWLMTTLLVLITTPLWAKGAGELKLGEDSFEILEEAGVAVITVERSRGEDGVVSVDYATVSGGSATAGVDYEAVSGTLMWAAGDGGTRTFAVPILDDAEAEGREIIELALSHPTGGAALSSERSTAQLIIRPSDGGGGGGGGGTPGNFKFDESSFEVGEEAGVVLVRVERSGGDDGAATVDYSTFDASAIAGADYTAVSGTLSWAAGDGTTKTFAVPILDDDESEGAEIFDLALSNPTGGAGLDPLRAESTVVILASDGGGGGGDDGGAPGVLKFDESSFEVLENAGLAVITVERSQGENGAVSVTYSTADGSAEAGSDYQATQGTLSWGPGDGTSKTFSVEILEDDQAEGRESINLRLSQPTGGAQIDSLRGTATLNILANDGGGDDGGSPGQIKLSSGTFQALEGGGMAVITVERSRGENGAVSVDYQLFDGTALAGEDYTPVSGTLSWASGDGGDKTFMVPILDDGLVEGNETLEVQLLGPTGGAILVAERDRAQLTVVDDDSTACAANARTLCLLGSRFRVEVDWQAPQGQSGFGRAMPISDQSGLFWFFGPDNLEMLLKVLDGCDINGRQWVFFSATTNVEFAVTITDTRTGKSRTYRNPQGNPAEPVQDLATFDDCS